MAYRFPSVTEKIYSQKLYPLIAQIISPVSNIFPFSLDDIFYFLLILVFLILIALMLFRKISFVKAGKILVSIISITYMLFYFLWGFNYFREDLTRRLNLNRHQPNTESFIKQLKIQIENTNQSWCSFENLGYIEIDIKIEKSYKNLAQALKINYPAGKRKAKKITVSNFFAKAGISGYYGPFFNEDTCE